MAYVIKCDRCSKTGGEGQSGHRPQGWKSVSLQVKQSDDRFSSTHWKPHQFCPACVDHLDLKTDPVEETSAEKLVAILESMVDEAVSERDS